MTDTSHLINRIVEAMEANGFQKEAIEMFKNEAADQMRAALVLDVNAVEGEREELEAQYGQVWNTEELSRDFAVEGFAAPFVVVRRKSDGQRGSLMFQHMPRYYFGFEAYEE